MSGMGDTDRTEPRVFLRAVEERDIDCRVRWLNDPVVNRTLNFDLPVSHLSTKLWLQRAAVDASRRDFTVCLKSDGTQIGYTGLVNIDWRTRKAEAYSAIGEPSYWSKGFATEMRLQLNAFAFEHLGLNRLYAYVWTKNPAMLKVAKRVGFTEEGLLRADVFSHGEYRDRIVLGMLRSDYEAQRMAS